VSDPIDEFALQTIGQLHAVATDVFIPFVVHRLASPRRETEMLLDVELRDIGNVPNLKRRLLLKWDGVAIPPLPPGVGERTVTEWAALGIACAVVWEYAGARLSSVSRTGDRFDYWVSRDDQTGCLEVSGTQHQDLDARHRAKVRQLLDNPHGTGGYVVVVSFGERRVILSYHGAAEIIP
jgi:hypothetical protein